jgi:glycosyltransferase involved in cell wall biosynthesis
MPVVRDVASSLGADALVFDWVDEFSERVLTRSTKHKRRLSRWEDAMADSADVVFLASRSLADRRRPGDTDTWVIPHGTASVLPATSSIAELEGVPRPRIGFVGSISEWVDHNLVIDLANKRPQWSFVLVGPTLVGVGELKKLPNVTWLGERPHEQISDFIQSFDVGLIPYRVGAGTQAVSPVKLREYLAHGVPVVSSDLPELGEFGEGVYVGHGTDGFLSAIEKALADERPTPRDDPTWGERVETMTKHIDDVLGHRHHA